MICGVQADPSQTCSIDSDISCASFLFVFFSIPFQRFYSSVFSKFLPDVSFRFVLHFAPCWRAFDMSNKYYLLTYLPTYLLTVCIVSKQRKQKSKRFICAYKGDKTSNQCHSESVISVTTIIVYTIDCIFSYWIEAETRSKAVASEQGALQHPPRLSNPSVAWDSVASIYRKYRNIDSISIYRIVSYRRNFRYIGIKFLMYITLPNFYLFIYSFILASVWQSLTGYRYPKLK